MKNGYRLMFLGLLLASINLKVGSFTVFPPVIGWVLVVMALTQLRRDSQQSAFSSAEYKGMLLIILTSVQSLTGYFGGLSLTAFPFFIVFPLLPLVLEFLLFHEVVKGSVQYFRKTGKKDAIADYIQKDKNYIMLMGMTVVLMALSLVLTFDIITSAIYLFSIAARTYLLAAIFYLGTERYGTNAQEQNAVSAPSTIERGQTGNLKE